MTAAVASGLAFGAAMTAAGFHDPSLVVAQMKFQDWHMARVFMAATASSAVIYAIAEKLGYIKLPPKSSSPMGLFGRYDGNFLGGALLGAGVALSGACPGSLYTQLATGLRSGFYTLGGAVAGGIAWNGILGGVVRRWRHEANVSPEPRAVHEQLRLSRTTTLLLLEAVCLAVMALTARHARPSANVKPTGAVAGLLIGFAQLVSVVTRRAMLGASGAFQEAGRLFLELAGGSHLNAKFGRYQDLVFASSVAAGAWGTLQAVPALAAGPMLELPPLLATVGGVLMAIGAAMAGGCTSGHGISGMSLLSTSSFITIVSMFAAGAMVTPLVY
ncbi:sulfur transport domain-containing protein [Hirsutella rhossiliensis]|uniref:Sulfur transport domain-containing protein n=1 Tax=Hirsutella rhossiliensis TaxID=111463 RepID=A0A9P8N613_9HYPO|nr:sulfur transport domain-containing protein [Hirsutella rhossiliensis]KAH0966626.1 sulfur transport domain-containing protein [Hirsutella rhossiliensis]